MGVASDANMEHLHFQYNFMRNRSHHQEGIWPRDKNDQTRREVPSRFNVKSCRKNGKTEYSCKNSAGLELQGV